MNKLVVFFQLIGLIALSFPLVQAQGDEGNPLASSSSLQLSCSCGAGNTGGCTTPSPCGTVYLQKYLVRVLDPLYDIVIDDIQVTNFYHQSNPNNTLPFNVESISYELPSGGLNPFIPGLSIPGSTYCDLEIEIRYSHCFPSPNTSALPGDYFFQVKIMGKVDNNEEFVPFKNKVLLWHEVSRACEDPFGPVPTSSDRKAITPIPKITISPNPVSDYLTISSQALLRQIQIIGVEGKVWKSILLPDEPGPYRLGVSELPKGIYLIKINEDQPIRFLKL